ncbi:MAG: leucine-rich repeat domain-containing protein [Oscillospiraceae bacterium]
MNEIEELKQRVAILEETLDTLRQMQLSEEISEYISSQQRMLNITALLNSLSDTKLSVGTTEKFVQELHAKKEQLDANVKKRLDEAKTYTGQDIDYSEIFEYQVYENDIEITGFIGGDDDVVIPAFIEGKPVTKIGDKAFLHSSIKSVVFPNTLRRIGEYAFQHCHNLREIILPDSVTYLSDYCFSHSGIENAIIKSVSLIPQDCFWNCTSLKTVILSEKTAQISNKAFYCSSIQSIVIPKSVECIRTNAFANSELRDIFFVGKKTEFWEYSNGSCYPVFINIYPKPTIHCYEDSEAYEYAKENGFPVEICDVEKIIQPTKKQQAKKSAVPKGQQSSVFPSAQAVNQPSTNRVPQKGDKVRHKIYGEGEIMLIDKKMVTVKFGSKMAKFMRDTVFAEGRLEMVDS